MSCFSRNNRTRTDIAVPIGFALVVLWLCTRFGVRVLPLLGDNQHYFFIAERFAAGIPPHVSHFDPKAALSMMLTGWAIQIGRFFAIDDLLAARIASILALAVCTSGVWLLAVRLTSSRVAATTSVLLFLGSDLLLRTAAMGARPKIFLIASVVALLIAVCGRGYFVAGLLWGVAFLCWQPGALAGLATVEMGMRAPRPWRATFWILSGFVLIVLFYEAYFAWSGALGDQIEQVFLFPSVYMSHEHTVPRIAPLVRHGRWLFRIGAGMSLRSLTGWASLAALATAAAMVCRRPRGTLLRLWAVPGRTGFLVAAAAVYGFALYDYQGPPDSIPTLPFAAIAAGGWLSWVALAIGRAFNKRCCYIPAGLLMTLLAVAAVWTLDWRPPRVGLPSQKRSALEVGRLLDRGLSVYASGCTHLLAFNHVNNFLPYGFFLRGMREYLRGRFGVEVFVPERAGIPDVILWSRKRPGPLSDWLLANYRVVHVPEFARGKITVWLRRGVAWRLQSRYPSAFRRDSTAGETVECEIGGVGPEWASKSRSWRAAGRSVSRKGWCSRGSVARSKNVTVPRFSSAMTFSRPRTIERRRTSLPIVSSLSAVSLGTVAFPVTTRARETPCIVGGMGNPASSSTVGARS